MATLERGLNAQQLIELLTYRSDPKIKESNRESLLKELREVYELDSEMEDFEQLNDEWGTAYKNWDSLIDSIWAGEIHNETIDEIRERVYRLSPLFKIICQTPHMILGTYSIACSDHQIKMYRPEIKNAMKTK